MKWIILAITAVMCMFLIACTNTVESNGTPVLLYKSPTCGCCGGYAAELERNGYDVEVIQTTDMDSIKDRYNIPKNMESCHTSIIGDYVVEGHVPLEAVEKLLSEQPAIEGIALPNMPSGTPGMPGPKKAPYHIYALTDEGVTDYTTI